MTRKVHRILYHRQKQLLVWVQVFARSGDIQLLAVLPGHALLKAKSGSCIMRIKVILE